MKIAAIVAEYNPFHLGHKYQIDALRKMGFTHIIAVMSGNFVQRGDVAILNKTQRTRLALENGADLVLEIPTSFCLAPAQKYAHGAIGVLKSLGIDFTLCFGSETGDVQTLCAVKDAMGDQRVQQEIANNLKSGKTYSALVQSAVQKFYGEQVASVLDNPNDTLGIEYLKALDEFGGNADVIAIKRKGVGHLQQTACENFASASLIRKTVAQGESVADFVPENTHQALQNGPVHTLEHGERALLWATKTVTLSQFCALPDECEGLGSRLYTCAKCATDVQGLFMSAKTKRYTLARIRRMYLSASLGIDEYAFPPYIRALGCTTAGTQILNLIAKQAQLPVVTSYATAKLVSKSAEEYFEKEARYTDFYSMFAQNPTPSGEEFRAGFVKI